MPNTDNNEMIVPPDLIYITYIRATPQAVWNALTQTEFTAQFFFGRSIESDWKQGSPWRLVMAHRCCGRGAGMRAAEAAQAQLARRLA